MIGWVTLIICDWRMFILAVLVSCAVDWLLVYSPVFSFNFSWVVRQTIRLRYLSGKAALGTSKNASLVVLEKMSFVLFFNSIYCFFSKAIRWAFNKSSVNSVRTRNSSKGSYRTGTFMFEVSIRVALTTAPCSLSQPPPRFFVTLLSLLPSIPSPTFPSTLSLPFLFVHDPRPEYFIF